MICTIMQPTYMPWLGYFDLIDKVDVFVFYNDVQLAKRGWQVRNKIKGPNGEIYLTIPIKKTKPRDELNINEALINSEEKWVQKHLNNIKFNYKKSTYFEEVFQFLNDYYCDSSNLLGEFNIELIKAISLRIGLKTKFINSSALNNISGQKDLRLTQICKTINADSYLSPPGSSTYINEINKGGKFVENKIDLFYHNYSHPVYKQMYEGFIPYMGIYVLLFNEGFENVLEIIRGGSKPHINYLDF